MKKKRRTQKQRTEASKRAILNAALKLFAKRGFRNVALEEVVARAKLTRGALYHHFKNKEDLFIGVVEAVEKRLAERIVAAAMSADEPLERLSEGCRAFLDGCLDPAVQRILLFDAPTVLGIERWRTVDADYGLGLLRQGLQVAMDQGILSQRPVRPLAHVLLGAMTEAGLFVAQSDEPEAARAEVATILDAFLDSLRAS